MIRRRKMVRSFDGQPVEPDVVARIVAAGLRAPSAGFTQGVDLVVLEGAEETGRYWDAALPGPARGGFPWPGLLRAPVLVVVVASEEAYRRRYAEPDKREPAGGPGFGVPWWHVDGAFAALLVQLAAVDEGLGALFFAVHRPAAVAATLGIPGDRALVGTVALGHPGADRPSSSVRSRPRRRPDEVVHRGRW